MKVGDRIKQATPKKVTVLKISDIRLDFQPPENLIEEKVREYVERRRRGESFAPIRVRFDGTNYFCEDGFHRLEAARRMGFATIKTEVRPGTLAEMEDKFAKYLKRLKVSLRRKHDPRH